MTRTDYRVEHDSMGALDVPTAALWGAQTQRAIQNFPASGLAMPRAFIRALGLIKHAAAGANAELGDMPPDLAAAIQSAALEVADGRHDGEFPIDVFQTGSGTSSNMNANEVIATLAARRLGRPVHANDQVNMGQSSNDVIPTAIHVAAALLLNENLLPALKHLSAVLERRAGEFERVVKTGRTHLMDAMPITLAQELGGWRSQIDKGCARLASVMPRLLHWRRAVPRSVPVSTRILSSVRCSRAISARPRALSSIPATIISKRCRVRIPWWSCPGSSRL
jgi:fumarate hydratase class II